MKGQNHSTKVTHLFLVQLIPYIIVMPYNAFANRADPDQGLLCLLWKYD